jgi:sensor domain CHASE-containing protein
MLAIAISWTAMVVLIYFGSSRVLKDNYQKLEREQAKINITKARHALNSLMIQSHSFLMGSALWDEMYDFIVEFNDNSKDIKNKNFLTTFKLNPFQFSHYLDYLLLYTKSGELHPAHTAGLNQINSPFVPIPAEISDLFANNGSLRHVVIPTSQKNDVLGLIPTYKGFLIIAAHSVHPTSGNGESHGTLILTRYITKKIWNSMLNDLNLNATLYTLPEIKVNANLQKDYINLLNYHINMVPVNSQTLFIYDLLKDINQNPVGMMQVIMPREINLMGDKAIQYFNLALLAGGLVFIVMLFYLLRILVINRLNKMNMQIEKISKTKDFSIRIPEEGKDELNYIAQEMNKMLQSIQNSEEILMDIINSMPSYIILVDEKLKVLNMNTAAMNSIQVNSRGVLHQSLFTLFPYLAEYNVKFHDALSKEKSYTIDKISHLIFNEIQYLNVVIYPLIHRHHRILAIRIDNVSERIQLENQLEESNKLSAIGVVMNDVLNAIEQPIEIILAQIIKLKKNIHQSLLILKKYSQSRTLSDLKAIAEEESSTDIAKNFVDTKKMINEVCGNAAKVTQIVKSLKNKSRISNNTSDT